jgi:predicted nucleotidyltransferase
MLCRPTPLLDRSSEVVKRWIMVNGPATLQSDAQSISASAVSNLLASFGERLVAVVLYGSRARGDFHDESDWDLLLLIEGLPESYFDRYQLSLPALYLDIGLDGRVLYERGSYATERLEQIRQIIDRVGLYRERTPAGDMWRWRQPPPAHWSVTWES